MIGSLNSGVSIDLDFVSLQPDDACFLYFLYLHGNPDALLFMGIVVRCTHKRKYEQANYAH